MAVIAALFAAIIAALLSPPEKPLVGRAQVVDGDTLRLGAERVRLIGIDAPELEQNCADATGVDWACGRAARDSLKHLLATGDASCAPHGRDRYGRILARCVAGGTDLGLSMIEAGLAVADGDYAGDEAVARTARKGIWSGSFVPPAQWRAEQRGDDGADGLLARLRRWFR